MEDDTAVGIKLGDNTVGIKLGDYTIGLILVGLHWLYSTISITQFGFFQPTSPVGITLVGFHWQEITLSILEGESSELC